MAYEGDQCAMSLVQNSHVGSAKRESSLEQLSSARGELSLRLTTNRKFLLSQHWPMSSTSIQRPIHLNR